MVLSAAPKYRKETMHIEKNLRLVAALFVTALTAFGGTLSPQLLSGDQNRQVEVIVQYAPTLIGSLLSPVCGVLNLVELLPLGELCSMTASAAAGLANNPNVAHVSVNNALQGDGNAGIRLYAAIDSACVGGGPAQFQLRRKRRSCRD
jgi:hypothetical protein